MRSTGFPLADAEDDFLRARRHQAMGRLVQRLRGEPDDVIMILPFDDVITALGRAGEISLGLQAIRLDTIVGSVDKTRDYDRRFRPTSTRVRERWKRIAVAQRRGDSVPAIDVYRVGDMHFVRDGHHRVSVAHALGHRTIDATVTEVRTTLPARGIRGRRDLIMRDQERVFRARVPLPASAYDRIVVTDPSDYGKLSDVVEAWGFRLLQDCGEHLDRPTVARRWLDQEYRPVVRMLESAGLIAGGTDAEAYLRVAEARYALMRSSGDEAIIEQLKHRRGGRRRG